MQAVYFFYQGDRLFGRIFCILVYIFVFWYENIVNKKSGLGLAQTTVRVQDTLKRAKARRECQRSISSTDLGTPDVSTSCPSAVTKTSSSILIPIERHLSGIAGCPSTG